MRVTSTPFLLDVGNSPANKRLYNDGPSTVYYKSDSAVSSTSNDGTIAAGASLAVTTLKWLATASGTTSDVRLVDLGSSSTTTGLPAGGTTGQALVKNSSTDGDAGWGSVAGGGPTVTGTTGNLGTAATVAFGSAATEQWLGGTLNGNLAITTTSPAAGSRLVLIATQDGTGGRTVSIDGNAIPVPSAASAPVIVVARWVDGTTFRYESAAGNPMTAVGDMIIGGTSGSLARLAAATDGQVLTLVSGVPAWQAAAAGGSGLYKSPFLAGQSYQPALPVAGTNVGLNNGTATATPFVPGRTSTISAMRISIQTVTGAAGVYRLGVYSHSATTGKPTALVADAGTVVGTSTGVVTISSLSISLTADTIYWLVCVQQLAASNGALKGHNSGGQNPLCPTDPTNLSLGVGWSNSTGMTGALPASTPSGDWAVASSAYLVQVQAA